MNRQQRIDDVALGVMTAVFGAAMALLLVITLCGAS